MAWSDARGQLATHLAAVTATVDSKTFTIKKVEQYPVTELPPGETPAFIMALPEVPENPARISGWRTTEYVLQVGLFVHDAELQQAAKILDEFREAVLTKFDGSVALEGNSDILRGPRVRPANAELFGGIPMPHVSFEFEVRVSGAATISV